jgi:hypothetical protein
VVVVGVLAVEVVDAAEGAAEETEVVVGVDSEEVELKLIYQCRLTNLTPLSLAPIGGGTRGQFL